MRLLKCFLPLMALFFSFSALAQESSGQKADAALDSCIYSVEGYVFDITSLEPLPFATVQLKNSSRGTIADENGAFSIQNICQKEFDLIVSHVGYKKVTHHHDPYHKFPQIFLAPEEVTLQSIIIESEIKAGELSSATVEQLGRRELEQNRSASLGELASRISGVSMLKTGQNVVKPIIHGLHSNRVLTINNGVRHEFQNWGADHAPEIDPSLAENISVIKGAATVRYGPDALGGVLLINPPKLEFYTALQGEAAVTARSNGRAGEASLQLSKGFHKVALQAQASVLRQGDLHTPDYQLTNTGKREESFTLGGRFHWKSLDFFTYYSHFQQQLGLLRASVGGNLEDIATALAQEPPPQTRPFSYEINNPQQAVQHDMLKLKTIWNGQEQSVELQYALQLNQRQEFDVRRGTNNQRPAIDLQLLSHTVDGSWYHPELLGWEGSLGVQAVYQDNNNLPGTNTVPFVPNFNTSRLGFYLIEAREIQNSRLEFGLRYDIQHTSIRGREPDNDVYRHELNFRNMTATLGIVKELREGHTLRSNLGTAWRPPNVSELYSFGTHQASIEYGLWRYRTLENQQISTNDILSDEERPVPSEVGFKWINSYEISQEKMSTEITAYANYIQNFIYNKPAGLTQTVRGAFPYFIYDQDNALFAGVDVSTRLAHTSQITSELRGSFLWARNVTNAGNFVGLPPPNLQYEFTYRPGDFALLKDIYWHFELDYTFRQYQSPRVVGIPELLQAAREGENLFATNPSDFDILPPPAGYLLARMGIAGQIKRLRLGIQVHNLLNKSYRNYTDRLRYFADDTGRNFILSLSYQI